MTFGGDHPAGSRSGEAGWTARWSAARLVIVVAAATFLLLAVIGALSPFAALIAFAVIAAAAMIPHSQPRNDAATVSRITTGATFGPGPFPALDAMLAGLPDPIIVLDRRIAVLAYNPHALSVAPALTRGAPLSFALRHPDILDAARRAAASGRAERTEFFERVPADRWYEAVIAPVEVTDGSGRQTIVIVTLRDLTPLRRMEQMRADFVANASHELRTPLATLSGFIDTLLGAARDDAAARTRFLGIMREQANRMGRLIDDLLSLSRIELKTHIAPTESVDLQSVLGQVADSLAPLAQERGVTISLTPSPPIVVLGDRDELIRVFENLVENALKYGASGKRVEVSAVADDAALEAVVTVRDFGPGIAPDHLPRLTERFYRVDVADSRMQGGTGLGLALVKHILTRHRGRLTIESLPGQGAAFIARLPLKARTG